MTRARARLARAALLVLVLVALVAAPYYLSPGDEYVAGLRRLFVSRYTRPLGYAQRCAYDLTFRSTRPVPAGTADSEAQPFVLKSDDGESLVDRVWTERRAALESLGLGAGAEPWRVPVSHLGEGSALLAATKRRACSSR